MKNIKNIIFIILLILLLSSCGMNKNIGITNTGSTSAGITNTGSTSAGITSTGSTSAGITSTGSVNMVEDFKNKLSVNGTGRLDGINCYEISDNLVKNNCINSKIIYGLNLSDTIYINKIEKNNGNISIKNSSLLDCNLFQKSNDREQCKKQKNDYIRNINDDNFKKLMLDDNVKLLSKIDCYSLSEGFKEACLIFKKERIGKK